ncbi:carbohydrate binding domain-containing protein [Proteiniphilum sp.]|uniref:carbohydrate binding domain-containing protein n=1 Tax=Proteiniphilum sp. TaxID=1926877 RepID=UPI002B20B2AC|nr:hypothetical protein [Proteiniphilum sp.]MEA4916094.1 hypothetical protein [Proteiniphilum sp.]
MHTYFRRIIIVTIIISTFSSVSCQDILIENNDFQYQISSKGKNIGFIDKTGGTDYLYSDTVSYCAYIVQDGEIHNVRSVSLKNNILNLDFGKAGVKAKIHIKSTNDYISFKVVDMNGKAESLTFLNIPLQLEAMPYESFATCALSLNLFTYVRQLPALQNNLWATCYERFGMQGAEVALLGTAQKEILPTIRKVIEEAKDIPFSDKGGAWAQMNKEGFGSYLMNFGTLTEETVDEWIETCKRLGFTQIDNHGGGGFFEFGTFELNKEKWPDGWDSFKRINQRLHAEGISSIFHTYAFFIDKNSEYVTPVPSEDLGYAATFTLAEPLYETSTEVVVKESTANISTITGFHTENSVTLRIGNELITFSGVTQTPPYKFTGLTRGANGTKPSSYNTNETAFHLSERFGRFVPGPETDLFKEMARRHAEIVSECEFDGIYLDAIDGSAVLAGEENFWYYGTKFIFEIARHLKKPVGMEMSSMAHHWWHYRSRYQAWDRPVRGYKRFIDIHLASIKNPSYFLPRKIKSNEWEHGLWRGHSPLIDKYASAESSQTMLPLHLGWWGNQTWAPPQIEPVFFDDIEYLGSKMIGNNAGFSQLGGMDEETFKAIPLFRRNAEILKQYETLRQINYFSDSVRSLLRQAGKEFTLCQDEVGGWHFKPAIYRKHKVLGVEDSSALWIENNPFEEQPIKLRIEPLMAVKSYDDPSGIILTNFSQPENFIREAHVNGVSGTIEPSVEKSENGEPAGKFTAMNDSELPRESTYINIEKTFTPGLDLSNHQALGVWIKGDGNGQLLNLSLRSPIHTSHGAHGDHFIKIDFTGWKYFELVEIESSEISNYLWPDDSHFYVYDSYRHTIQFENIDRIQFWYNNLPHKKSVNCTIGTVKALPTVPVTIENPEITVNGEKLVIPVKMESGMFLELLSPTDCKLYGSKGELLQEIRLEKKIPLFLQGDNKISFSCTGTKDVNIRAQITVIGHGKPIE